MLNLPAVSNTKKTKFAALVASTFMMISVATPAFSQSGGYAPPGECFVVAASRKTLEEVQSFIDGLDRRLSNVRVFESENGWYAITVGTSTIAESRATIRNLVSQALIPSDSICSSGQMYVAELQVNNLMAHERSNDRAQSFQGSVELLIGTDLPGDDLTAQGIQNSSFIDCVLYCVGREECSALTFDTRRNICYLKTHTSSDAMVKNTSLTSALVPKIKEKQSEPASVATENTRPAVRPSAPNVSADFSRLWRTGELVVERAKSLGWISSNVELLLPTVFLDSQRFSLTNDEEIIAFPAEGIIAMSTGRGTLRQRCHDIRTRETWTAESWTRCRR